MSSLAVYCSRYICSCAVAAWLAGLPAMAQAPPQKSFSARLDAEANPGKAAELLWEAAFTRCGDSLFFLDETNNGIRLVEYKIPTKQGIDLDPITRADQLNGIQAQGTARFSAAASRWIDTGAGSAGIPPHTPAWSKWTGGGNSEHPAASVIGTALASLDVYMTRKSGHWEFSGMHSRSFADGLIANKIGCDAAAQPNPFARYQPPQEFATMTPQTPSEQKPAPAVPAHLFVCAGTELYSNRGGNYTVQAAVEIDPSKGVYRNPDGTITDVVLKRDGKEFVYTLRKLDQQPREACTK